MQKKTNGAVDYVNEAKRVPTQEELFQHKRIRRNWCVVPLVAQARRSAERLWQT